MKYQIVTVSGITGLAISGLHFTVPLKLAHNCFLYPRMRFKLNTLDRVPALYIEADSVNCKYFYNWK